MTADKKRPRPGISGTYWRLIAVFFILSVLFYVWSGFFSAGVTEKHTINYSQFMLQLNEGNVKSVSIKKLLVTGEFTKEVSTPSEGETKLAKVKYFKTYLHSFQGEGLLSQLREKNVLITIEPEDQGFMGTFLVAILPWVLIIGVWVFIMRRSQQIQGGPGGLFTFGASKAKLYDTKKPSVTTFKD